MRKRLNTVELYSGLKSFSKVMFLHGHATFTIDNNPALEPDQVADITKINLSKHKPIDILWASPPCTCFSVASMGHHWGGGRKAYEPKTQDARDSIVLVEKTLKIIHDANPRWFFIENPMGVLRNLPVMNGLTRHTIWYCHYGDTRAKPTDIWTNATWWKPRPPCHNRHKSHPSDCCCHDHEAAPRGAKTGTQGIGGARDRGQIPPALFEEILSQMP